MSPTKHVVQTNVSMGFSSAVGLPLGTCSLRRHLDSNAPRFEHHWRSGDIVIWDTIGLQHRRDLIPAGQRRHMRQHGDVAE
jgi:Taurine catabolism dioxygenase TauD, TfdA family